MPSMFRPLVVASIVLTAMPLGTLSAQATATAGPMNAAKVTIASGPDRGTYDLEVPRLNQDRMGTCRIRPRRDAAGSVVSASFYPPMEGNPGLMEAATTFNVGSSGTTTEVNVVVTFLVGQRPNLDMRAYEVETRPYQTALGRGSATFTRRGSTATARVEAETAEGVKLTMEIQCNALTED